MKLVLGDIEAAPLLTFAEELRQLGADAMSEVVDVADAMQMQAFADRVFQRHGTVHVLFNNAGVGGIGGYLWETSDQDWQWLWNVNVMGVVHGIHNFVPRMLQATRRGEPGHIVNLASMASWMCPPLKSTYSATKHAVLALSETLVHDMRMCGSTLGVSVVCPVYVATGIMNASRNRPAALANTCSPTESQRVACAISAQSMTSGSVSAPEVASMIFEGIRTGHQIIFTHSHMLPEVRMRVEAALRGTFDR